MAIPAYAEIIDLTNSDGNIEQAQDISSIGSLGAGLSNGIPTTSSSQKRAPQDEPIIIPDDDDDDSEVALPKKRQSDGRSRRNPRCEDLAENDGLSRKHRSETSHHTRNDRRENHEDGGRLASGSGSSSRRELEYNNSAQAMTSGRPRSASPQAQEHRRLAYSDRNNRRESGDEEDASHKNGSKKSNKKKKAKSRSNGKAIDVKSDEGFFVDVQPSAVPVELTPSIAKPGDTASKIADGALSLPSHVTVQTEDDNLNFGSVDNAGPVVPAYVPSAAGSDEDDFIQYLDGEEIQIVSRSGSLYLADSFRLMIADRA